MTDAKQNEANETTQVSGPSRAAVEAGEAGAAASEAAPQLDAGMIATFICPITRSKLKQDGNHLVSDVGGLRYPWQQGIWRLIADQAELPEGIESLDDFKQKFAEQIPD